MEPLDLSIGTIGLDSPALGFAVVITAEDFDLLQSIIDSAVFEAIAGLAAESFDIASVPFEAITLVPELEAPEFQFWLAPIWEPSIAPEAADGVARGGGHAIPLWQLLAEEPEAANDDEEDDDELALTVILLLAA